MTELKNALKEKDLYGVYDTLFGGAYSDYDYEETDDE